MQHRGRSLLSTIALFVFGFSMNIFSEHVIERTDLPKQLIKDVSGEYILDQTQPKVCYILQLACIIYF